jgi:hypothetical protein
LHFNINFEYQIFFFFNVIILHINYFILNFVESKYINHLIMITNFIINFIINLVRMNLIMNFNLIIFERVNLFYFYFYFFGIIIFV